MADVRGAYLSFKAATRYLAWSLADLLLNFLSLRKEVARQLASLHPKTPRALFDSGFACFCFELNYDNWLGYWTAADAPRYSCLVARFEVASWAGVPWHRVEFSDLKFDGREFRAVPLSYAEKHLRIVTDFKEVA